MQKHQHSALIQTRHFADYEELCNTIHEHDFPWGYNKPSHVLIRISEGRARVVTAITLDNIERSNWLFHMANKHQLELNDPIPLDKFLVRYVAYKLTEDPEVFGETYIEQPETQSEAGQEIT